MARWIVIIAAVVAAAGVGLLAGYMQWGEQAAQVEHLRRRAQSTDSEAATLRDEKRQLEERVDQLTKEEERLAQENEILRKEQTKQELLSGQGGELPARPPK